MKLVIQKNNLLPALQSIIGAIERRQTMPMLANILLVAEQDEVHLTATDLEIRLSAYFSHDVIHSGRVAIPARKLFEICKSLPDNSEIELSVEGSKATLKSGRSRFSLACLPAEGYPEAPEFTGQTNQFSVEAKVLLQLISRTSFSMANQDVRYYLNGLMLELDRKMLKAVATDGHRLAYSEAKVELDVENNQQVIVPRKGVLELQRLLANLEGNVELSLSANHIQFSSEGVEFTSKLIDGRFPDYNRVIPAKSENNLLVSRKEFKEALQRTAILSNEKYRGIRVGLDQDLLRLQADNSEQEEAQEELSVDYQGDSLEIGFNVQYLLDVSNAVDHEMIELSINDPNSSALIQDPERSDTRYVIMPMRL